MRNVLVACLLGTLAIAPPAVAAPSNPAVALAASTGPLALVDLMLLTGSPPLQVLGLAGLAICPTLEGAGQLYAGDPTRALIVSGGAVVASSAGAALGFWLASSWHASELLLPAIGWGVGANVYAIFAGLDAVATSTRLTVTSGGYEGLVSWGAFPREHGVVTLVGVGGPGLAYRAFVSPEVGFQGGINLLWGNTGASGGGQVIFSPFHRDGQRFYGFLGGAFVNGSDTEALVPSMGVGSSTQFGEHVTVFLDASMLAPLNLRQTATPIPATLYPQLGLIFEF
jgi:hypothetical protein